MYASIAHVRAEGLASEETSDERITLALEQATSLIDRACGWFFEPRDATFTLSGRGGQVLELPVPPIRVDSVRYDATDYPGEAFEAVGAPIEDPQFCMPKLIWAYGGFPLGVYNVRVSGRWGYTVPSATHKEGVTPPEVQRAALLLAKRYVPLLASEEAIDSRSAWRLIEERTRDQSYRMQPREDGPLSGDPEVDGILLRYRRPIAMGAA